MKPVTGVSHTGAITGVLTGNNGFFSMRLVCKDSNGEVYYSEDLNPKKAEKYIGRDMVVYVLGDAYKGGPT